MFYPQQEKNSMLELGIGMFGDLHVDPKTGETQATQQRIQEIIEEIKLMDEVGLDFFGMGEHHRPDYAVASPEIILAAAATVTKNIKLGSAVSVLSSSDPVKLYQDFATVDLISNGRAEIMAGRGSFIESFPLFGYDLQDYDDLFEEKLNLLLQINKNEKVTWSGQFRKPLTDQPIYPRAYNKEIPVWIAVGGTPASLIRAGKLGLPVVFAIIGGAWSQFLPLFNLYKNAYKENGHDMSRFQVGVHMHSFFGDDATSLSQEYYPLYAAQMNRIGSSRGWAPYSFPQFERGRTSAGHLIVGDPVYATEKIHQIVETLGTSRFSAHMDVGAPLHKDIMKSIEIYGTKIAPALRKLTS